MSYFILQPKICNNECCHGFNYRNSSRYYTRIMTPFSLHFNGIAFFIYSFVFLNQCGDREGQHLRRWATPDTAQHGEQVPVDKRLGETMRDQELGQRLVFLCAPLLRRCAGNGGRNFVEAQDVAKHAPKVGSEGVTGLAEDGAQRGPAPLQCLAVPAGIRDLDRKRHIGWGQWNFQLGEERQ